MTEAERNERIAAGEAREISRIEAHLHHVFGSLGPVERVFHTVEVFTNEHPSGDTPIIDATELTGWLVLGRVGISRGILPVWGGPQEEDEDTVKHRSEILDAIRAAYGAGRDYKAPSNAMPRPPAGHQKGDPEVLWQHRIRAAFGGEPPQRILDLDATVRNLAGSITVERVLKSEPGWIVGNGFMSLDRVLLMSGGELEIEMLVRVTEARREQILAAGRAL